MNLAGSGAMLPPSNSSSAEANQSLFDPLYLVGLVLPNFVAALLLFSKIQVETGFEIEADFVVEKLNFGLHPCLLLLLLFHVKRNQNS